MRSEQKEAMEIRILKDQLRQRYARDTYNLNAASKERLRIAAEAFECLNKDERAIIKEQVRYLRNNIKGLGAKEALALVWSIGKTFADHPDYFESLLSEPMRDYVRAQVVVNKQEEKGGDNL